MDPNDIAIVIPAFNEERSIVEVLRDLPETFRSRVVVVDNNSTDDTAAKARDAGAIVVREPEQGYGAACLRGVDVANEKLNPKIYVFLDADYSDFPQDIERLLTKLEVEKLDLVIGSRNLGEAEPQALLPQAKFGNWLATTLMYLFTGVRFTDLGPFRAVTRLAYEKINMCDRNFGWTMEMQIKSAKLGLQSGEVSVRYRRRIGISKITGTVSGTVRAGYKILYTLFRYAIFSPNSISHKGEKYNIL